MKCNSCDAQIPRKAEKTYKAGRTPCPECHEYASRGRTNDYRNARAEKESVRFQAFSDKQELSFR